MATDDDLNLTQGVAVVVALLILLVPLAVALAAWCKRRYAQAVVQLQAALAGVPAAPPAAAVPAAPALPASPRPPLQIVTLAAAGVGAAPGADPAAPARRLRRRMLAVQFVAGLTYWWVLLLCVAVALAGWQQLSADGVDSGADLGGAATNALLWPLLVLPAALGWAFQAGLREGRIWATAALAALAFGAGLVGVGVGWVAGVGTALVVALLAALLAAFLRPAARGAGPPLLAALTVGLLAFSLLVAAAAALDDTADTGPLTLREGLFAGALLLALLALAGWVAWRVLLRLARRYAAKRFSEMQLALGAYWGLVTAFAAGLVLLLAFDERTGATMEWVALAIALVWFVWRGLQRAALWWARRGAGASLGALLMLRVFKPSQRSEAFTDRFLARWRFAAPVWMIAGPDLAGAYMEPDEFFAFLGRRLRERFVADAAELPARLQALDGARDPDGRFRVSELFCSNATWKAAVLALIERAGVVLLDLREYTAARAGTRFELEQVLRRVPLQRVVIIVEAGDDPAPLHAEIQAAWQRAGGPAGDGAEPAVLRLLALGGGSRAEMKGLFRAAAAAASPRQG